MFDEAITCAVVIMADTTNAVSLLTRARTGHLSADLWMFFDQFWNSWG